ncbi:MAG: phosphocholine cytidylyltransferase family protein [Ignavibacteria bacterium]|nr:phosphocholine cytidylyltransferase family protein [Ignavibacteria bacterium]
MKCVILAAGVSRRLRPITNDTPKCLLKVGGIPILERIIRELHAAGIVDIAIVLGYRDDLIRRFLRRRFPDATIAFVKNTSFRSTNNAYSLFIAREFCLHHPTEGPPKRGRKKTIPDHSFLLLDGDIIFSHHLLTHLKQSRGANRVAVRVSGKHNEEEMRVRIDRYANILEISKHVSFRSTFGESLGIEIFSPRATVRLFAILGERMRNGNGRSEYYESAFQQMIDEGIPLKAIDVSSFPAAEIDTKEDLEYAEHTLIPLLDHA